MPINPAHQLVILARLSEFCQFHGTFTLQYENDPWEYMRRKLMETEEPLSSLKKELFEGTKSKIIRDIRKGQVDEERYTDFKLLFERLLSPGDFADLAIHLSTLPGDPDLHLKTVIGILDTVKPHHLFIEERKPLEQRSPSWEKLIKQLQDRLDLKELDEMLNRKPKTTRRKALILRRLRRNVAEYCSVLHIPTDANQTFTPFMLPRIEALIAACLRFLSKNR